MTINPFRDVVEGTETTHSTSAWGRVERHPVWAFCPQTRNALPQFLVSWPSREQKDRDFRKTRSWQRVTDFVEMPIPDGALPALRRFLNVWFRSLKQRPEQDWLC